MICQVDMQGEICSTLDCATVDKMIIGVTKNRHGRCMILIFHEFKFLTSLEGLISVGEDGDEL